jgi:hypothetical protein
MYAAGLGEQQFSLLPPTHSEIRLLLGNSSPFRNFAFASGFSSSVKNFALSTTVPWDNYYMALVSHLKSVSIQNC